MKARGRWDGAGGGGRRPHSSDPSPPAQWDTLSNGCPVVLVPKGQSGGPPPCSAVGGGHSEMDVTSAPKMWPNLPRLTAGGSLPHSGEAGQSPFVKVLSNASVCLPRALEEKEKQTWDRYASLRQSLSLPSRLPSASKNL